MSPIVVIPPPEAVASLPVMFDVVGTPAISGNNANILTTANAPITPTNQANRIMCALVACSHANTSGFASYPQLSCTSSVSGAMTRLTSASINVNNSNVGSVHFFYQVNPSVTTHNLTARFQMAGGAWGDRIRVIPFSLYNVNQASPFGTVVIAASSGNTSLTVGTSASSSLLMYGSGSASSPGSFNQTNLQQYNSVTDPGFTDYLLLGSAGAGVSRTFTSTNSGAWGAWGIEFVAA